MTDQRIREIASQLRGKPLGGSLAPSSPWDAGISAGIKALKLGPAPEELALKAGLLLWNDDLDASHSISQDIETETGSFWHGIMHRMEGDYSNAKYWFRLTGVHPVYPEIAAKASARIAEAAGSSTDFTLLRGAVREGAWNPYTFVDIVEKMVRERRHGSISTAALEAAERIQQDEMVVLLSYSFQQVFGGTLFDPDNR